MRDEKDQKILQNLDEQTHTSKDLQLKVGQKEVLLSTVLTGLRSYRKN